MRALLLCLVASCYSAQAVPGAPCSPQLANCPEGQACTLVQGDFVCSTGAGSPVDATDDDDDAIVDAPDGSVPAGAWQLRQTRDVDDNNVLVLPDATAAGSLIIVAVETNAQGPSISVTDDVDNIYFPIVGSRSVHQQEGFGVDLWFASNARPGATTITAQAQEVFAVVLWEVGGIRANNPIDRVNAVNNQGSSGMPRGASIETTAPGDFVVSVIVVSNTITDVVSGSPFTNDHTTFGNGWAHLTAADAPAEMYQAQWEQPQSGRSCASSASFFVAQ